MLDLAVAERRRALERLERPAERCTEPRQPKPHELLAEALASGRLAAERAAELLRPRPADVPPIAAGKAGLAKGAGSAPYGKSMP